MFEIPFLEFPPLQWARTTPRHSDGGEQLDNARLMARAHRTEPPTWGGPAILNQPLGDREFQQLDGAKVADITAHTLGGVKQHIGFG